MGILKIWLIWGIAAFFYGYEFLLRVSPCVMQTDLMQTFNLDSSSLGFVVSLYYWAYATMQIPGGILLDKYGPRIILTIAAFICSIAIIYLGFTESVLFAGIARFMVGFGSSVALIGTFKLIGNCFPPNRFAFVAGLTLTFGTIGASLAGKPLVFIIDRIGWRHSLYFLGIIGFLNTLLLWWIVIDNPPIKSITTFKNTLDNKQKDKASYNILVPFKSVIKNSQSWLIGGCTAFMYIPVVCFGEFWGVPYVMKLCSCNKSDAAGSTSLIFIGITIGAPLFGYVSDCWKNRKIPLYAGTIVVFLIMNFIIYIPELSLKVLSILMFVLGVFLSSVIILFALIRENNPNNVSAAAVGFGNFICMIIPGIIQYIIGAILKTLNPGLFAINETSYSLISFKLSFLIFPTSLFFAWLCLKHIRESYALPCL